MGRAVKYSWRLEPVLRLSKSVSISTAWCYDLCYDADLLINIADYDMFYKTILVVEKNKESFDTIQ